jgi:hypothetical protein
MDSNYDKAVAAAILTQVAFDHFYKRPSAPNAAAITHSDADSGVEPVQNVFRKMLNVVAKAPIS